MLLVSHIIIALSSLVLTGAANLQPTPGKLRSGYALVAATLASGTYLVIQTHAPLTGACLSGLVYLGVALAGLIAARHKLARQES